MSMVTVLVVIMSAVQHQCSSRGRGGPHPILEGASTNSTTHICVVRHACVPQGGAQRRAHVRRGTANALAHRVREHRTRMRVYVHAQGARVIQHIYVLYIL